MEIPNIARNNDYYLIYSSKSGMPYLSEDKCIYCFELRSEGMQFVENHENTEMGDEYVKLSNSIINALFENGADGIRVKPKGTGELFIELKEEYFKGRFHNRDTVRNLILLKQTGEKRYLRALKAGFFYMPVLIEKRKRCSYQRTHYCQAVKDEQKTCLLFADIRDFEEWKKDRNEEWNAVSITIKEAVNMIETGQLNIYGYLILNKTMIKKMAERRGVKNAKG